MDEVFKWLDRAYEERDSRRFPFLHIDPIFGPLRSAPRLEELLRRVGLPPVGSQPPSVAALLQLEERRSLPSGGRDRVKEPWTTQVGDAGQGVVDNSVLKAKLGRSFSIHRV